MSIDRRSFIVASEGGVAVMGAGGPQNTEAHAGFQYNDEGLPLQVPVTIR